MHDHPDFDPIRGICWGLVLGALGWLILGAIVAWA